MFFASLTTSRYESISRNCCWDVDTELLFQEVDNRITYVGACSIAESIRLGFSRLDTLDLSCIPVSPCSRERQQHRRQRFRDHFVNHPSPEPQSVSVVAQDRHFLYGWFFLWTVGNGITSTGAIYINKLIRRTDGIVSVLFDSGVVDGGLS